MIQKPTKIKWQNVKMRLWNGIKTVREVEVTIYPDGTRAIAIDEYNRILWELHMEWKRDHRRRE